MPHLPPGYGDTGQPGHEADPIPLVLQMVQEGNHHR